MKNGSSAVECQTLNRESPDSNNLCCWLDGSWGIFVISTMPQFNQLYKWVVGLWVNSLRAVTVAWLNVFQRSRVGVGMNRSARGGVKHKALWAVRRTGYRRISNHIVTLLKPIHFYRTCTTICMFVCVPQVRVESLSRQWSGSLQIGLTTMAISDSTPVSLLPQSACELTSKVTWVISGSEVKKNGVTVKENYTPSLDRLEVGSWLWM